jgi:hypothetical protein
MYLVGKANCEQSEQLALSACKQSKQRERNHVVSVSFVPLNKQQLQ